MSVLKAQTLNQNLTTSAEKSQDKIEVIQVNKKQNIGSDNIINSNAQNEKLTTSNIFNQTKEQRKTFNIFTQKQQGEVKKNIFAGQTKSVNLFNISTVPQTGNLNIFKSASKPLIKNLEEDDDKTSSNASSSLVLKAQSEFRSQPLEFIMKFKYQNPWTVIRSFNLRKFKNGLNSSKEYIYLTFEKHSQNPDKVYIFVRARQTKVFLYQGFGIKNVSDKMSGFMDKEQNLKFHAITQHKKQDENDQKPSLVKEQLKIQFENVEDLKNFKQFMITLYSEENQKSQSNQQSI